jgi:hypothetical protein
MKINELLTELTFMGHTCTKDCSGHAAGYNYALQKGLKAPTKTPSKSFDFGTGIATKTAKAKKVSVKPKAEEPEAEPQNPNASIPNKTI